MIWGAMSPAGVGPPGFLKLTVYKDENRTVTMTLTVYTVNFSVTVETVDYVF